MVRFRVRSLLILTLLCGIGIVIAPHILRPLDEALFALFPFMVFVTFAGATSFGWRMSSVDRLGKSRRFVRAILVGICILFALPAFYLVWARYRWLAMWELWETWGHLYWPQPWPYPDQALDWYGNWLDKRNPPPPGFIKLHGEYYTVHRHINWTVFPIIAIGSLAFGLATPEIGRLAWRRLRLVVHTIFRGRKR